jgi:hypothetical protein
MTKFLTDKQIEDLIEEYCELYDHSENVGDTLREILTIREALNRWGTLEPTALEDREPQQTDLDDEDCCWWWEEGNQSYQRFCGDAGGIVSLKDYNKKGWRNYTHWLPHWVIKQPSEKKE